MQIPVLIEPVASNSFRAICGEPLRLMAEAPTRNEAVEKLRQLIADRVAAGAEFVGVAVDQPVHPLARFAGMLKDEPLLEAWKQAMADYRGERDEDPIVP